MKRITIIWNVVLFFIFVAAGEVCAGNIDLKTRETKLTIDDSGYFTSVNVGGKEILRQGKYPLITACVGNAILTPEKISSGGNQLKLTMSDGGVIVLKYKESDVCITLEVITIPEKYNAIIYGPLAVNINDVVGDIIGVVQGNGVAFGMQALNIKTNAGIPTEYIDAVKTKYSSEGTPAELSVGLIPDYRLAATNIGDGSMFHLSCRRRNETEYRQVGQTAKSLTLPVEGDDAVIKGSKVAFFGCKRSDALSRIGEIEIEQGLPHPMFDGEWGKTAQSAMCSYLISDFSENDIDFVLNKAKLAGFTYIYHSDPFKDWGHFNWNPKFVSGGDEAVKKIVDKAKAEGISVGVHTLSNFLTTNDAYVTPVPSEHLLKQGVLTLTSDLDDKQTEITIKKSEYFSTPMTLNAMQIDSELITYGTMEEKGDEYVLKGCTRGAFGTTVSAHSKDKPLYKLSDYPYKTLFPDLTLQDSFSDRLVEMFNNTGLKQISFDGLEGCMNTGQDDYATARFVSRCYDGWKDNVLNDASNLNHFTWHISTRMNWGEPWGEEMRTGQVANRIKNQDFFQRNLFPRMLGWFLIRLADRNFECTTREDLEWALSESAGFDAGYAMTVTMRTLNRHGQIDQLLGLIKDWDELREADAFTEEQKVKLKDPLTEWRLERKDANTFMLYQIAISKRYRCNLGEMQPGQPGGSDWSWDTANGGRFAFRLKVDGDGSIKNPTFTTQKGVIKFPCKINSGQYLLYDFSGKAVITDKNYNTIETVEPQGNAELPVGASAVSFSCEKDEAYDAPEVIIRYITRGAGEQINKK